MFIVPSGAGIRFFLLEAGDSALLWLTAELLLWLGG